MQQMHVNQCLLEMDFSIKFFKYGKTYRIDFSQTLYLLTQQFTRVLKDSFAEFSKKVGKSGN